MRTSAVLATLFGLAWAVSAGAANDSAFAAPDQLPDWLTRPGLSFEPRFTLIAPVVKDVEGPLRLGVVCTVTAIGDTEDCSLRGEGAERPEVVAAVQAMSRNFRFKPALRAGVAVPAQVTIPVNLFTSDGALGSAMVHNPPFVATPSVGAFLAAAPSKNIPGYGATAVWVCGVTPGGGLANCRTTDAGPGAQEAARRLLPQFRVAERLASGDSLTGVAVTFQVAFPDPYRRRLERLPWRDPIWVRRPGRAEVVAAFPEAARRNGLTTGSAVLTCVVGVTGQLGKCVATKPSAADAGFEAAALSLAGKYQVSLWTQDGAPSTTRTVEFPIFFAAAPGGSTP